MTPLEWMAPRLASSDLSASPQARPVRPRVRPKAIDFQSRILPAWWLSARPTRCSCTSIARSRQGSISRTRAARAYPPCAEGAPEGYRLPISDSAGLVVVRAPDEVLLHVDREVAARFDLEDPSGAGLSALWSMVCALDEAGSMGGALLSEGVRSRGPERRGPIRLVVDGLRARRGRQHGRRPALGGRSASQARD